LDVWCHEAGASFGYVEIPATKKEEIDIIPEITCQDEKHVLDLGEFQSPSQGVQGHVYLVNSKTLRIVNFHFDALENGYFLLSYADSQRSNFLLSSRLHIIGLFWASSGSRSEVTNKNFIVSNEKCEKGLSTDALPAYNGTTLTLYFPRGKSAAGFFPFFFFL